MPEKFRLTLFLTLVAVLMIGVPATLAQETFGLSVEDFALFSSPNTDADSVSFNFSLDLNVTGAPDGAVNIALTGTGVIGTDSAGLPVADLVIGGNADTPDGSSPVELQFRVIDGVLYMNMGDGSGWIGQPLDEMLEGLEDFSPVPLDPTEMDPSSDPEAMEALGSIMGALANMDPTEFIGIARLGDTNGQAHFQVNINLSAFLSSDAFTELMNAAGEMSGDESMAGMGMMMSMLFQNMSLTFDQFIDLTDNRVRQGILDFMMNLNPAMMGAESAEPVDVRFRLDVSNLQYNVPVSVSAPEGAMMMPSGAGM
ncbi:MAG TPA: hypothetical protein VKY59_04840 [Spirillospora sp.]|nr:hypothetical protein [Spirillospora sp.]